MSKRDAYLPTNGGHDHRQDADRRRCQARPDRGVAHVTLQPLRDQQRHAEERRVGHHHRQRAGAEVAVPEQLQVDNRILVGQLPDQEHRQRHHGHAGQHHDLHRREPVLVVAQVEHQLQGTDTDHQGDQADVVHLRLLDLLRAPLQLVAHHQRSEDAQRHVDQEDPFPAVVVGDPATEDRPADRRHHRDHRQQRQRLPAFLARIDRDQQRLRDRVHRAGHEALQRTRQHQHAHALRQAAQQRGDDEGQRGPDEQLAFAEAAAEPAGQRQRDGRADRERGDHPGRLLRAGPQVAGDGRQRNVGDGGVEHLHERRHRQAHGAQGHAGRQEPGGRTRRRPCTRSAGCGWSLCGHGDLSPPLPVAAAGCPG